MSQDLEDSVSRTAEAWFVYAKGPGRFSAMPVTLQGWLALLAGGGVIALCSRFLIGLAAPARPGLGVVILFATVTIGVLLMCRLIISKGRRVG